MPVPTVKEMLTRDPGGENIRTKVITYPDGRKTITPYKGHLVHGFVQEFIGNQLSYTGHYKNGTRTGQQRFFENGACVRVYDVNNKISTSYPERQQMSRLV
jgi:hypothetical protein